MALGYPIAVSPSLLAKAGQVLPLRVGSNVVAPSGELAGAISSGLLQTPGQARAAYLAVGATLRRRPDAFGTVEDQHAAARMLVDLHAALGNDGLGEIPGRWRDVTYWTRKLRPAAQPLPSTGAVRTIPDLIRHPDAEPVFRRAVALHEQFLADGIPEMRRGLDAMVAYLETQPDVLPPAAFTVLHRLLQAAADPVRTCAADISKLLEPFFMGDQAKDSASLGDGVWTEVVRIFKFLEHDMGHIFPELWGPGHNLEMAVRVPDQYAVNPGYQQMMSDLLRQIFCRENLDALMQLFAFPAGMVPDLARAAWGEPATLDRLDLAAMMRVISGTLFWRIITEDCEPRATLLSEATRPPLVFRVAAAKAGDLTEEGVYVIAPETAPLTTRVHLLISLLYNTVKNTLQAIGRRYRAEDPEPYNGTRDECNAWRERQHTVVHATRVFLGIEVSRAWGDTMLDSGYWVTVDDEAGGFPMQTILMKARAMVVEQLEELVGGTGFTPLAQRCMGLTLAERQRVIGILQSRLGLMRRALVDRLFNWVTHPDLATEFSMDEIMAMAAIIRLSGREDEEGAIHSGFGAFGIAYLSPSADVMYLPRLVVGAHGIGTQIVMAVQDANAIKHSAQALHDIVANVVPLRGR